MSNQLLALTRRLYLESLSELVRHYAGEEPTVHDWMVDQATSWVDLELGFGGFQMSGVSTLAADPSITKAWLLGEVEDAIDWLGELNNQLLSRLKNKLLRHGVVVRLSTPADSCGGLMVVGAARPECVHWVAEWSGGRIAAALSVAIASHAVFAVVQENVAMAEGSHCLF